MKSALSIISAIIIFTSVVSSAFAEKGVYFKGGNDTLTLYKELSSELMKDPAGVNSYRNIIKLLELSRDAGRVKTAKLFRECAARIKHKGAENNPVYFVLINSAEHLENGPDCSDSLYKGIDTWLLCGPWQKFGRPDLYYPFPPESGAGFSGFKSIKSRQHGSRIYPFGFISERRGIVYAAASFSTDVPVRIWIISNTGYRLFVNRVEVMRSGIRGDESLSGITVNGSRDYTLLLKIADNRNSGDPFFRVIITDLNNKEIKPDITGANNSGNFGHEEIFSSDRIKSLPGFHAITPMHVRDERESEFTEIIAGYRERFPDSDYYLKWEADFYRSRDEKKFSGAMEKIHLLYCDHDAARAYIKLLADKGEKRAARRYAEKFEDLPSFRAVTAEVEKSLSTPVQWRKNLLEKASATGDPLYFYYMGNAEMDAGLDPVLYWEKGLSIRGDMREMREAADTFENGGGKGSLFYSGGYTDFHPEFLWNGIKRKVTVRIFANGKYMAECEEIIPAALAEKGEFSLIKLKDIRVLYALRCSGGEAAPLEYEISEKDKSVSVKVKKTGKADFLVLKYTGYSVYDQYPFYIMKDIELKHGGEDISEVMLEIISEGIKPSVTFMDKTIYGQSSGNEGETVYRISEKFNYKNSEKAAASAAFKPDDRAFSLWYNSMFKVLKSSVGKEDLPEPEQGDIRIKTAAVKEYISKNYSVETGLSFEPRTPAEVIYSQKGTSEELAILASVILEKAGVKGFIAFIREKGHSVSETGEAALYIPESKGRGNWLRFTDRNNYKHAEALLIKGDSFEIIPASDK